MASSQLDSKTVPLKILVDKKLNKVVFVESNKDFVDTLFSFLSLPLATIVRLLATNNNNDEQQQKISEPSPFLGSIENLYKSVQNITSNNVWINPICKQMLLHPRNPCASMCMKLFLNIDDTEPSSKIFVCDSCYKFTTFQHLACTCGKPTNKMPQNLDSESQVNNSQNEVFVRENGSMFVVFDNMKIIPSSLVTSMQLLMEMGYSDLTQLEEITYSIGKEMILKLLKYTLTSQEPLTKLFLASNSKTKDNPPNQSTSTGRPMSHTDVIRKMDVKVLRSKSQNKIITEANGDFVDFIFSFLTMPLGSIVKVLDGKSFAGCVDNLYKSLEKLDTSFCTESRSVLLNPGVAPQHGCPNQPLNISDSELPTYYYGKQLYQSYMKAGPVREGGLISKSPGSILLAALLTALEPRSPNRSKEGVVGFVNRATLYLVGDDLTVKPLSVNSCLSHLKDANIPLDDLEVKVISIGEAEALSLLGASLTSKFTISSALGDLFNVPKQETHMTPM